MGKSNVKSKQVRIHKKQRQQLKSVTDRKKLVKEKHSLLLKHGQKNKIVRWDNEVSLICQFKSANKYRFPTATTMSHSQGGKRNDLPKQTKKSLYCSLCDISYATDYELLEHRLSLMHHMMMEQKQGTKRHTCTVCQESCGSLNEYSHHTQLESHKAAIIHRIQQTTNGEALPTEVMQGANGMESDKGDQGWQNKKGNRQTLKQKHRGSSVGDGWHNYRHDSSYHEDQAWNDYSMPPPGYRHNTHWGQWDGRDEPQWNSRDQPQWNGRDQPQWNRRDQPHFHNESWDQRNWHSDDIYYPERQHSFRNMQLYQPFDHKQNQRTEIVPGQDSTTPVWSPPDCDIGDQQYNFGRKAVLPETFPDGSGLSGSQESRRRSLSGGGDQKSDSEKKDKLQSKAEQIINDVLMGGTGKLRSLEKPAEEIRKDHDDRGASLLKKAESLCREIKEKRHIVRINKEGEERKKKQQDQERIDRQIRALSQRSQSRVTGILDRPVDQRILETKQYDRNRSGYPIIDHQGTHNKPEEHEIRMPVLPTSVQKVMRKHAKDGTQRNNPVISTIPGERYSKEASQVTKKLPPGKSLDKDSLMKLVNSPRSRKERMQVANILKKHNKTAKTVARPKLHLHSGSEDRLSDADQSVEVEGEELPLSMLPEDIRLQIEQLMTEENAADTVHNISDSDDDLAAGHSYHDNSQVSLGNIRPQGNSRIHSPMAMLDLIDLESSDEDEDVMDIHEALLSVPDDEDDYQPQDTSCSRMSSRVIPSLTSDIVIQDDDNAEQITSTSSSLSTLLPNNNLGSSVEQNKNVLAPTIRTKTNPMETKTIRSAPPKSFIKTDVRQKDLGISSLDNGLEDNKDDLSSLLDRDISLHEVCDSNMNQNEMPTSSVCPPVTDRSTIDSSSPQSVEIKTETRVENSDVSQPKRTAFVEDVVSSEEGDDSGHVTVNNTQLSTQSTQSSVSATRAQSTTVTLIDDKDSDEDMHGCPIEADCFHSEMGGKRRRQPMSSTPMEVTDSESGTNGSDNQLCKRQRIDNISSGTGRDCMSEVLEISLREESVRQRLQETDVAINRLQDMLLQTQEQLNRRQEMKTKLLQEEEDLRSHRIKILKGALAERSMQQCADTTGDVQNDNSDNPVSSSVDHSVSQRHEDQSHAEDTSFTSITTNPSLSSSIVHMMDTVVIKPETEDSAQPASDEPDTTVSQSPATHKEDDVDMNEREDVNIKEEVQQEVQQEVQVKEEDLAVKENNNMIDTSDVTEKEMHVIKKDTEVPEYAPSDVIDTSYVTEKEMHVIKKDTEVPECAPSDVIDTSDVTVMEMPVIKNETEVSEYAPLASGLTEDASSISYSKTTDDCPLGISSSTDTSPISTCTAQGISSITYTSPVSTCAAISSVPERSSPPGAVPVKPRKKSSSFCLADSLNRSIDPVVTPSSTDSNYTVQYVGCLEGEPNLLQKLAKNFAALSDTPYMFVEDSDWKKKNSGDTQGADSGLGSQEKLEKRKENQQEFWTVGKDFSLHKSPVPVHLDQDGNVSYSQKDTNKSAVPVEQADSSVDNDIANQVDIDKDSDKSSDRSVMTAPDPPTGGSHMITRRKSAKARQNQLNESLNSSKSKASPFYPSPQVKVNKKRLTKKVRDQQSLHSSSMSVDSSSESAMNDDGNLSPITAARLDKRKKGKRGQSPIAKIVQEYLHAESSSDVEIEGLEANISLTSSSTKPSSEFKIPDTIQCPKKKEISHPVPVNLEQTISITHIKKETDVSSADQNAIKPGVKKKGGDRKSFPGHTAAVNCLYFWGTKQLVTGCSDGKARVYNINNSQHVKQVFKGSQSPIMALVVTNVCHIGARILTGGEDNKLVIYEFKNAKMLKTQTLAASITCLEGGAKNIFIGLGNGNVLRYDPQALFCSEGWNCSNLPISGLCLAKEGGRKVLCVASEDMSICLRDARSGLLLRMFQHHTHSPVLVKVCGHQLFSCSGDKTFQVHNLTNCDLMHITTIKSTPSCVDISKNWLVVGTAEGVILLYDRKTYDLKQIFYGPERCRITTILLTSNVIVVGTDKGSVESIKVNITKDQVCQFRQCSMVFGLYNDLLCHIMTDHVAVYTESFKCPWLDCSELLCPKEDKTKLKSHYKRHVQLQHSKTQ